MFLDAGVLRLLRRAARSLGVAAFTLAACAASWLAPRSLLSQVPGELRGRVTDATTGRAVGGAHIEIADRVESVRSDADGAFMVRGLEPGTYAVTVRAVGYSPFRGDVAIENGRATTLDAAIQPIPAQLAAVVTSAGGTASGPDAIAFDRTEIEASGRHDVGELLSSVPGVVVTRNGGPGQPTQASIRGSSAAEVLVVVDGVAVNSPLTGVADLSRLSLANVERVTVLEGAQSARFGGRALAGVIVIETRRAAREESLALDAGSWDERGIRGSIGDAASGRSGVNGLLSAERRTTLGDFSYDVPAVRGGGTARRANSDVASTSVLGVAGVDGSAGSVRVRADWQSTDRGIAGSIVQPSLTGRDDERHESAALEFSSTPSAFSYDGSLSVSRDRAHLSDPTPPFGSAYDDVLRAYEARAATSATASNSIGAATVGGDARLLDIQSTALAAGSPSSQQIAGAYAGLRGTRHLGLTELSATLNGRVDHDDLLASTVVSPHASVGLARSAVSLSASIGDGYSPPSLADQFFHEGVLIKANPSLAPERTRGETEFRATLRELSLGFATLGAEAAAYHADVHGMILWSPDFRFIWSPANVDVRRSGWQIGGRVALARIEGVTVSGSLDQSDVTYTGAAQTGQVVYRPRVTARVAETLARPFGRLDVETRYVGSRRTVAGTDLNSLDPYRLTDVHVSAPIVRAAWRLEVAAGVENVFDQAASMLVDYPFGGRRWTVGLRTSRGASANRE
jgi:vitamin B12 transporter